MFRSCHCDAKENVISGAAAKW